MLTTVTARAHIDGDSPLSTSPLANPRLRLNVVCPYYTMFPLNYPLRELAGAKDGEWVLDPFCGRGTTVFAARLLGLPSVGIDADGVAATIAKSKLVSRTAEQIEARCEQLFASVPEPSAVPAGEFWELAFDSETLRDICRIREALLAANESPQHVLLRALVLGILHGPLSVKEPNYLSNQMPRTYATKPLSAVAYWQREGLKPRRVDVGAAIARRARYLLKEVPRTVEGQVLKGDSRAAAKLGLDRTFSHVVTSPPYLGMRTYRPDQWLRHWFIGGPADVDYSRPDMLPAAPQPAFIAALGEVWAATAKLCLPEATLAVRFGSLPSMPGDPESVLRASLAASEAGWKVESVTSAGPSTLGKRQAMQMGRAGQAVDEIDLRARLVA